MVTKSPWAKFWGVVVITIFILLGLLLVANHFGLLSLLYIGKASQISSPILIGSSPGSGQANIVLRVTEKVYGSANADVDNYYYVKHVNVYVDNVLYVEDYPTNGFGTKGVAINYWSPSKSHVNSKCLTAATYAARGTQSYEKNSEVFAFLLSDLSPGPHAIKVRLVYSAAYANTAQPLLVEEQKYFCAWNVGDPSTSSAEVSTTVNVLAATPSPTSTVTPPPIPPDPIAGIHTAISQAIQSFLCLFQWGGCTNA